MQLEPYLNTRVLRIAKVWLEQKGRGGGGASNGVREPRRPIRPAGSMATRLPQRDTDQAA